MGRSGYSDEYDGWALVRWRGAVKSAIRGKRGQAFLREMATAMDDMSEKSLIAEELEQDGAVCALGSVGNARGIDMREIDPDENEVVAQLFGIPHALACEIMYENDEGVWRETPEERWKRVRQWINKQLIAIEPEGKASLEV